MVCTVATRVGLKYHVHVGVAMHAAFHDFIKIDLLTIVQAPAVVH